MELVFVESFAISNGQVLNKNYHNWRFNRTRNGVLGLNAVVDLFSLFSIPSLGSGLYKGRVVYNHGFLESDFHEYQRRDVKTLQLVFDDTIDYSYKYLDRSHLSRLKDGVAADDIIIVKNGQITDTSFSNIVFYDGKQWITPMEPLLQGTQRQFCLDSGIIVAKSIRVDDIWSFESARLINALNGWDDAITINICSETIFR